MLLIFMFVVNTKYKMKYPDAPAAFDSIAEEASERSHDSDVTYQPFANEGN
jgi:hypothetical protein